jgi:ribosomal-protein-alanine N-acetyltransferase
MLTTDRLTLRHWREEDREPLAAITGDPMVMHYFPTLRTPSQSDAWMSRAQAHINRHGFGVWAAELTESGELIGFVGLSVVPDWMPPAPGVELVWTLGSAWWGQGFATEAARAAMLDGYDRCNLRELLAFTAAVNHPSRRVMQRLLMTHEQGRDFDHPRILPGHPLRRHVLYRRIRPAGIKPIRLAGSNAPPE